ncbi:MAG: PilZ domain-containing protein [Desulfobacterales bacterium]|nr:MAG: PilZ domain-containing protein [Desulfobacterales bacterium]
MPIDDEKREFERQDHDAPIVYAYHGSDKFFGARMCNFGKGGMCFDSNYAIKPGSDIYIMMENFSSDAIGSEIYDGYLAEVRWCRKITIEETVLYRVGVQYYQTIIK